MKYIIHIMICKEKSPETNIITNKLQRTEWIYKESHNMILKNTMQIIHCIAYNESIAIAAKERDRCLAPWCLREPKASPWDG